MAQITCRYCSTTVESRRSKQILCGSDDCKRAYLRDAMAKTRASRPAPARFCRYCSGAIGPVKGKKMYCSEACARSAHLQRRRDEYAPEPLICEHCAGQIPYKSRKRRYCSQECQTAGIAKEARWKAKGVSPSTAQITECALCGSPYRRLVIDHDHSCCPGERACGKCFRGMLCRACNVALGMFQESPVLLRKAARYLEDFRQKRYGVTQPQLELGG